MCTTLSRLKTLLNQEKSTPSKYLTHPALMSLTNPCLACTSPYSTIIFSYKHSWRAFKASTLPCWLFLPLFSIHSPCDMCHSLIGYEEAQSMCSPLNQSEPSLSLHLWSHLDHRSFKPLAYKLNPLPSQKYTIIQSTIIMPFWKAHSSKEKP